MNRVVSGLEALPQLGPAIFRDVRRLTPLRHDFLKTGRKTCLVAIVIRARRHGELLHTTAERFLDAKIGPALPVGEVTELTNAAQQSGVGTTEFFGWPTPAHVVESVRGRLSTAE